MLIDELSILIPSFGGREYCVHCFTHILNLIVKVCGFRIMGFIALIILLLGQFNHKLKAKPTDKGDETVDLPIDLKIESQLNMLEAEVNGKGVGDEEPDVDLEDDEIAGDVVTSDDAAVTEIICDAEASIRLDPLPTDEANLS